MNFQTPLGVPELDEHADGERRYRTMLATVAAAARGQDDRQEEPAPVQAARVDEKPTPAAAPVTVSQTPRAAEPQPAPAAATVDETDLRAEYGGSPALQSEFSSEANFIAFRKAEREGRIRYAQRPKREVATLLPAETQSAAQPVSEQTRLLAEYQASAALRGEFRSEAAYLAFKRAEADGHVKLLQGSAVRSASKSEPAKALDILQAWKSDGALRKEFGSQRRRITE